MYDAAASRIFADTSNQKRVTCQTGYNNFDSWLKLSLDKLGLVNTRPLQGILMCDYSDNVATDLMTRKNTWSVSLLPLFGGDGNEMLIFQQNNSSNIQQMDGFNLRSFPHAYWFEISCPYWADKTKKI